MVFVYWGFSLLHFRIMGGGGGVQDHIVCPNPLFQNMTMRYLKKITI